MVSSNYSNTPPFKANSGRLIGEPCATCGSKYICTCDEKQDWIQSPLMNLVSTHAVTGTEDHQDLDQELTASITKSLGGVMCGCSPEKNRHMQMPIAPAGMCPFCGVEGPLYRQAVEAKIAATRRDPRETPPVSSVSSVSLPGENTNSGVSFRKPLTWDTNETNSTHTAPEDDLLAGMRDGKFLNETYFEPLKYPIPGIVPEGFFILAAPPKVGKSWMVLDWLLAIAAGGRAMGHIQVGVPRHVLYLALEDGDRRMQSRCRTLTDNAPIPECFHYKNDVQPGKVIATIEQFMARYPDAAMVVVDTLGRVMPAAKGGNTLYQRDYDACTALTKTAMKYKGLSLGAVHHTKQGGGGDFVEQVSGTSGITGGVDVIMTLSRERNTNEGLLSITGRDIEEGAYALTCNGGRWTIEGTDLTDAADIAHHRGETDNLSGMSKDILKFIEQHPEGVASREIVTKFGKNAYMYIKRLCEGGYIDKVERGLYIITGRKI